MYLIYLKTPLIYLDIYKIKAYIFNYIN